MKQFIRELTKREIVFLAIIIIMISLSGVYAFVTGREKLNQINSFEECAAAGMPIMESFPEQCSADGKTFTRRLSADERKFVNPDTSQWNTYKTDDFGMSYPSDWEEKKPQKAGDSVVNIVSADFAESSETAPLTNSGYWLEVFAYDTISQDEDYPASALYLTYDEHLGAIESRQKDCGGSYETLEIDSKKAIKTDINCQGKYVEAYVYHNDKEYIFRLSHNQANQNQANELFEDIISTIVIE